MIFDFCLSTKSAAAPSGPDRLLEITYEEIKAIDYDLLRQSIMKGIDGVSHQHADAQNEGRSYNSG